MHNGGFSVSGTGALPQPPAGGHARPPGGRPHATVSTSRQWWQVTRLVDILSTPHFRVPSAITARSSDLLSAAARVEHELFKSSKSSNLYKAAVLKKVAELKKAAPTGDDGHAPADVGGCDAKQEAPSSSSSSSSTCLPEEMQGFTSASEIYSVIDTCTCVSSIFFIA